MLKEADIKIKHNDHKMLKYYTVKVEGLFTCKCGKTWSSYMTTVKVDLHHKCVTKIYKQACKKKCAHWVTPSFQLEDVMKRVILKYFERKKSLESENGSSDSTLVDSDVRGGNPRAPHEESLCERCQELGKSCW